MTKTDELRRQALKRSRNQRFYVHAATFEREARGARQDQDFPPNVLTRKILPRVWLGKSLGMGFAYELGERTDSIEAVE